MEVHTMMEFLVLLSQYVDGHRRTEWPTDKGNTRLYPVKNIAPAPFMVGGVIFVRCNEDAPWPLWMGQ